MGKIDKGSLRRLEADRAAQFPQKATQAPLQALDKDLQRRLNSSKSVSGRLDFKGALFQGKESSFVVKNPDSTTKPYTVEIKALDKKSKVRSSRGNRNKSSQIPEVRAAQIFTLDRNDHRKLISALEEKIESRIRSESNQKTKLHKK